jgi:uncharacterized protein YkwD
VPTLTRRLGPLLLATLLLAPAATAADAATRQPVTESSVRAEPVQDLVTLTNRQRAAHGLVAVRVDRDLMAIAQTRAEVMARNDLMSHTEPNGQKVFDRLTAAGIHWYAAGEILAWNNYPTDLTVPEAIYAWMHSPSHRSIMLSSGYNYVGYGAAVSASGKRYYAGLFVKERDETGAWAKLGSVSRRTVDAGHVQVIVHWSGADARLQVLTAGFRYFQVQARRTGHDWESWGLTTHTGRAVTWMRGGSYDVRVRARDKAGNWGTWQSIHITP